MLLDGQRWSRMVCAGLHASVNINVFRYLRSHNGEVIMGKASEAQVKIAEWHYGPNGSAAVLRHSSTGRVWWSAVGRIDAVSALRTRREARAAAIKLVCGGGA